LPYFFGERSGDEVRITGADARHLALSLRARVGESISVVEPAGRLLSVRLATVSPKLVAGRVEQEVAYDPEPTAKVTMAVSMLPAAALELVLTRCTEAGAYSFTLVQAERSVGRGARPERWGAIAREASMLAGRLRVPEVTGPFGFEEAWARAAEPFLLQRDAPRQLANLREPRDITLFIGPEGGWSQAELARAGELTLGLGPRNLRADTAALVALAVALAARGG
jgi:16S rRNA (uracil1498-N3)-methyltransferase